MTYLTHLRGDGCAHIFGGRLPSDIRSTNFRLRQSLRNGMFDCICGFRNCRCLSIIAPDQIYRWDLLCLSGYVGCRAVYWLERRRVFLLWIEVG